MIKDVRSQGVITLNTVLHIFSLPTFPLPLCLHTSGLCFLKPLSPLTAVNIYTYLGKLLLHGSWAPVLYP